MNNTTFNSGLIGELALNICRMQELTDLEKSVLETVKSDLNEDLKLNQFKSILNQILTLKPQVTSLVSEALNYPRPSLENSINKNQIACKKWILNSLSDLELTEFNNILILGGWYGILSILMLQDPRFKIDHITTLDLDPEACETANRILSTFVQDKKVIIVSQNMYDFPYHNNKYDLIINTSCEHIENPSGWLKKVKSNGLFLLQSNNYFSEPDHVSCVNSLEEFEKQIQLKNILHKSELKLKKYTRYMLIGKNE